MLLVGLMSIVAISASSQELPTARFDVRCEEGFAAGYPCHRVDLLAYLPLSEVGAEGSAASDLWGWTDRDTGRELVLLGTTRGTSFVEITNPTAPVLIGVLPAHSAPSGWRDIKVYRDHAYVVSEAHDHGMQVFDLKALLEVATPPVELQLVAHYGRDILSDAHNIAIDERSGFAYILGSNTCSGGLHIVDIRNPRKPSFAGCFSDDGYTHDAQCLSYEGPDRDYRGREICFASNEDTLTIVDVTSKGRPSLIARVTYPGVGYVHQTWNTDDNLFLLLGDELDEQRFGHNTTTRIFDITDLDTPVLIGTHTADIPAIDHNLYVRGSFVYQANYRAGLRIYDLRRVAEGALDLTAFFDVYPEDDASEFNGAWSVYPYFPSGVIAVSGIEQGLFVLAPRLAGP